MKTKKIINSGPVNIVCLAIVELALITILIVITVLLAKDYDAVDLKYKVIYFVSLPFLLFWAVFMGLIFGSRIVLTEDEVRYYGIGKLLGVFDCDNSSKILRNAEKVRYSDILSIYEHCDDGIPFTRPQKYIVLNMKDGTVKKISVSIYSKYRIEYVISEIIRMSGRSVLRYTELNV